MSDAPICPVCHKACPEHPLGPTLHICVEPRWGLVSIDMVTKFADRLLKPGSREAAEWFDAQLRAQPRED